LKLQSQTPFPFFKHLRIHRFPTAAETRMTATDGVFSTDGDIARLDGMVDLVQQYDAMIMVDDSHAAGYRYFHFHNPLDTLPMMACDLDAPYKQSS